MQDGINGNATYAFNSVRTSKENMYYSKSDTTKPTLETWYTTNIVEKGFSDNVVTGNYFCEQAKVAYDSTYATNSGANMVVYSEYKNPNFECEDDANGFGIVNASIGLLSYDEVLHAGGYYNKANNVFYLCNNTNYWTMSPAGISGSYAYNWRVHDTGDIFNITVSNARHLRPVLNLRADTTVTGSGTSDDNWVVQ